MEEAISHVAWTLLTPWEALEMDILNMKVTSHKGNRYLLVVIDRATKFLFASPPTTKKTLVVSRSIRSDPVTENTSAIMEHRCRWLKVYLDFGPTNHPRGQETFERMGSFLQEMVSELCQA